MPRFTGCKFARQSRRTLKRKSNYSPKVIKVITLFFNEMVAKYRMFEGSQEKQGEYAAIFEEEYKLHLIEVLTLEKGSLTTT